ncbi:hypothetical protein G8B32_10810 [Enterococcus faecalis]|uniref:hypothetical protein n=1 Tax=Enterococcus faecalis TaxID=1351 RepID=UPI001884763C|nr:hypothetical protein [Enterococcus faecalis]MBE9855109.1 hypothetical protein [Enterococcus faecalis]
MNNTNELLIKELEDFGYFPFLEDEKDSYSFELNFLDSNIDTLSIIDINVNNDGTFEIGKYSLTFFVAEYEELQKVISIFYGTIFSLKLERILVNWVRYSITIPLITANNIEELKEYVRTLKYLLEKVYHEVKQD